MYDIDIVNRISSYSYDRLFDDAMVELHSECMVIQNKDKFNLRINTHKQEEAILHFIKTSPEELAFQLRKEHNDKIAEQKRRDSACRMNIKNVARINIQTDSHLSRYAAKVFA